MWSSCGVLGCLVATENRTMTTLTPRTGPDSYTTTWDSLPKRALPSKDSVFLRWHDLRNRRQEEPGYLDSWWPEQCGRCVHWVPLAGSWGLDYGVCSNAFSGFDASVRYEHDGCESFVDAVEWAIPQDFDQPE